MVRCDRTLSADEMARFFRLMRDGSSGGQRLCLLPRRDSLTSQVVLRGKISEIEAACGQAGRLTDQLFAPTGGKTTPRTKPGWALARSPQRIARKARRAEACTKPQPKSSSRRSPENLANCRRTTSSRRKKGDCRIEFRARTNVR